MANPRLDPKAPRRKWKLRKWFLKNGGRRDDIPRGFKWQTPRVGAPARTLIKRVQRMAKLKHVSGQFDLATRQLLFPPPLRNRFMAVAISELGTHEWPAGSNWGPVRKFLAAVGIHTNAAWCGAYVVWVLKKYGYKGPLPVNPAWVPNWTSWAKAKKLTKPVALAAKGDILIFNWPGTDATPDHVGFSYGGWVNKRIYTVEGNIGAYGGQVTKTTRTPGLIVMCIDLKKLLALDKGARR